MSPRFSLHWSALLPVILALPTFVALALTASLLGVAFASSGNGSFLTWMLTDNYARIADDALVAIPVAILTPVLADLVATLALGIRVNQFAPISPSIWSHQPTSWRTNRNFSVISFLVAFAVGTSASVFSPWMSLSYVAGFVAMIFATFRFMTTPLLESAIFFSRNVIGDVVVHENS